MKKIHVTLLLSINLAPIQPLIKTKWKQRAPYDLNTPGFEWWGEKRNSATGYTYKDRATEYTLPEQPATTFKWDKMQLAYRVSSSSTVIEFVPNALLHYFNYSKAIFGYRKQV